MAKRSPCSCVTRVAGTKKQAGQELLAVTNPAGFSQLPVAVVKQLPVLDLYLLMPAADLVIA